MIIRSLIGAFFLFSIYPAFSASIAGTKCTKVGTNKTIANIKYTCIKSGSKLLWNKGVVIKTAPKVIPTPATSTSPSPSPSPSTSVSPTSTPAPSASQSPSKTVDIDPIRLAAFQSAQGFKCGNTFSNISFTRDVGPNFDKTIASKMDKLLENDFNCFDNYLPGPLKLKVFYVSQSDTEFVKTSVNPYLNKQDETHLNEILVKMAAGAWGKEGMAGGFVSWAQDGSYVFLVIHLTDNFIWEDKENKLITHEFTHVIQDAWRVKVNPKTEEDWIRQSPGYFTEGGADALAYTFEASSVLALDTNMKNIEYGMSRQSDAGRFRNVATVEEMLLRMKETIFPKDEVTSNLQYPIGGLIGEYLIGKYGFATYLTLIKNLGTYSDFSDNLKNTIGLTQDQMLEAAAPYVFKQWKIAMEK